MQPMNVESPGEIHQAHSSSDSSIDVAHELQQRGILNTDNQDPYSLKPYYCKIPGEDEHAPIRKAVYPLFNAVIWALAQLLFCFWVTCTCGQHCVCFVAGWYRFGETTSAILAMILEGVAAALVQESKNKPPCTLAAMVVAGISVLISGCDLIRRYRKGTSWGWFTFQDWFGIIMAILQFFASILDYLFVIHKIKFQLNFSIVPLAFAAFVVTAKLLKCCSPRPPAYQMVFCPHGTVDLNVLEQQQHRRIRFACVVCQLHLDH